MRISDWISDVCSSDLRFQEFEDEPGIVKNFSLDSTIIGGALQEEPRRRILEDDLACAAEQREVVHRLEDDAEAALIFAGTAVALRSEEHTSELQSLMRISYAVLCLKKKKKNKKTNKN